MGASVTGKPVWLAISVEDHNGNKLRSGEPVSDILPLIEEFKPAALLVNCSTPEAVTQALPHLKTDCPIGAYANGFVSIADTFDRIGTTVDALDRRKDLTPELYAGFAEKWVGLGASIIGGCCETGPAHIRELTSRIKGPRA